MGIENQEAFDRMMNEDRIRLRREIAARVLPELLRREYETPGDDSRAI